jgi:hypothetical protein
MDFIVWALRFVSFFFSLMHRFFNVLCGRFAWFLPRMLELFLGFALRLGLPQMHRFFNVLCGRFAWCFPWLSTFDFRLYNVVALLVFSHECTNCFWGLRFIWVCHRCTDFLMYYVVASHGVFHDFRLYNVVALLVFSHECTNCFWGLRFVWVCHRCTNFLMYYVVASLGVFQDFRLYNVVALLGFFDTDARIVFGVCTSFGFATDAQIF